MKSRSGKRCNKSFPFQFDKYLEGIITYPHQETGNNIQYGKECTQLIWRKQMTQQGRLPEVHSG
jgi:hypothetical protein